MTRTFARLGSVLDHSSYEWLLDEAPDVAVAIESEVLAGATPEDIRRFLMDQIGENRVAFINRVVSAARWLKGGQAQ